MLTKQQFKEALDQGKEISTHILYANKCNKGIYVNCNPECNCSLDIFSSFEEFWDAWGSDFEKSGEIIND